MRDLQQTVCRASCCLQIVTHDGVMRLVVCRRRLEACTLQACSCGKRSLCVHKTIKRKTNTRTNPCLILSKDRPKVRACRVHARKPQRSRSSVFGLNFSDTHSEYATHLSAASFVTGNRKCIVSSCKLSCPCLQVHSACSGYQLDCPVGSVTVVVAQIVQLLQTLLQHMTRLA